MIETQSRMIEYPDRRVWHLKDYEVETLILSYTLIMYLHGPPNKQQSNDATIQIYGPFFFRHQKLETEFDPAHPETLGPVLDILHKRVESLTVFRSGNLILSFENGDEITVEKRWDVETWESFGKGATLDIGMLCSMH